MNFDEIGMMVKKNGRSEAVVVGGRVVRGENGEAMGMFCNFKRGMIRHTTYYKRNKYFIF